MGSPPSNKRLNGWFTDKEWEQLRACAASAPDGPLVELGVFEGLSATAIIDGHREGQPIHLVDDCRMEARPAEAVLGHPDVTFHNCRTDEAPVPDEIALLHIDADHTEDGVIADLRRWGMVVKPGGWLVMHDFLDRPVKRAWDRWDGKKQFTQEGQYGTLAWFRRQ